MSEILKTVKSLEFWMWFKILLFVYELDEFGTTIKHPETINDNGKTLSKMKEKKDKENATFTLTI